MPEIYQSYRTFISSPGDVETERRAAKEVIERINRICRDNLGLSLEARTWEDLPPLTPHLPEEKIQDVLNKEVENAHFFILILFKRYGRIEAGHTKSNTERELDTILAQYEKKPQLKILAYFRRLHGNVDPGEQETKVRDFRQRLEHKGILYKEYSRPADFKELLTHDLYDVVLRLRLSPFKSSSLQRFWKLGEVDRPTHPRLAILFPPVDRQFMGGSARDPVWLKRLHPNMYFEDYKAIHKITKTLALIGFRDYRIYFQTDPPADIDFMNRVWVCFARSTQALQRIDAHYRNVRFRFALRTGQSDVAYWMQAGGTRFRIRSPLSLYLREQRTEMEPRGRWYQQLAKIICKDYGILARFRDPTGDDRTVEGALHDYYIGGIHGLGTWAAGWYVDRKYKHLLQLPEDEDVQLLLEVTYRDGHIFDVVDVSDKPAKYFASEASVRRVRSVIKRYLE